MSTRQYHSFLPFDSYHVTINQLHDVRNEHQKLLKTAQEQLKKHDTSLNCTVERLKRSGVMLLEVSFDERSDHFRRALDLVRSDELKNASILPPYQISWHLTLAYQYKNIETQEVHDRLDRIIHQMPFAVRDRFEIPLDKIRICHYNDMTRFTPI